MDPSVRHTHTSNIMQHSRVSQFWMPKTMASKATSYVSFSTGVEDGALPELYFEWSMMNPISILVLQRRCLHKLKGGIAPGNRKVNINFDLGKMLV